MKDAQQVIALAQHFAEHQTNDTLDALFAPSLTAGEAAAVVSEEAWVLGLD